MAGWNIDNVTRKLDKATNEEEVTVVRAGRHSSRVQRASY
jgi:hypothetical protein